MATLARPPASGALPVGDERSPELTLVAAMCAMTAGGIHLAVVGEHWEVSPLMSAFFVAAGVGQLALGAALRWRLPSSVLVAAIVAQVVLIGLYVASRTVDLPFVPPHEGQHRTDPLPVPGAVGDGIPVYPGSRIEPVGLLDLTCLVLELVLVAALALLLPRRGRSAVLSVLAAVGVLAVLARLSLVG